MWQILFFVGSDTKPFFIEEVEALSRESAVRQGWTLIVENSPIGCDEGAQHTTYRPGMATHFTVRQKPILPRHGSVYTR